MYNTIKSRGKKEVFKKKNESYLTISERLKNKKHIN